VIDNFREDEMDFDVNFPPREFMYTIPQICLMLDVNRKYFDERVGFYRGRSVGRGVGMLRCVNIAGADATPLWRVSETDFKLWLRHKGIAFNTQTNTRVLPKRK
jgi:hypothetical protein